MRVLDIRDLIITGSYIIGHEGKEPPSWKEYANALEQVLVENNGVLPIRGKTSSTCNVENCEKWQGLAKQKMNLISENEQLRQRLIDAGLEKPSIQIDCSRNA